MHFFQIGDKGEPLGIAGTSTMERTAQELDVLSNGETPAELAPIGGGLFGDDE
jgi:hypothetical protein